MKAVAYLRTSTLKEEDSISQNVQLAKIQEYCNKHNLVLEKSFYDNNVSGATFVRPELEALKSYVKANKITKVVVYKLDRIARSLHASLFIEKELMVLGAEVVFATQDMLNGDSAMIGLFKNIIASFADFERQMIIERTTHGKIQKLQQQASKDAKSYEESTIGGAKPYGMGSGDSVVAKLIFELNDKGLNQSEIADELNAKGILSPRGRVWKQPTIRYILNNPKYKGDYITTIKGQKFSNKIIALV
jgi:site-specific DNA recombinase